MIYRKNPDVVKRAIAGEVFLIPVKNRLADMRQVFVLHGPAEFIWDRLDGQQSTDQILHQLVEEYDVQPAQASGDLQELVRDLEKAGLAARAD